MTWRAGERGRPRRGRGSGSPGPDQPAGSLRRGAEAPGYGAYKEGRENLVLPGELGDAVLNR